MVRVVVSKKGDLVIGGVDWLSNGVDCPSAQLEAMMCVDGHQ